MNLIDHTPDVNRVLEFILGGDDLATREGVRVALSDFGIELRPATLRVRQALAAANARSVPGGVIGPPPDAP